MAEFTAVVDEKTGITTVRAVGQILEGELTSFAEAHNDGSLTNIVLWDFLQADLSALSSERLQSGIRNWANNTNPGDRQAFVLKDNMDFGIGRMIEAYAELEKYKSRIQAFRSIEEATEWLLSQ